MMRASELFQGRKNRFGLRNSTVDDPALDSPPADANSHRRTTTTTAVATNRGRNQLHDSHNNRRDRRQDFDGCNRRGILRHRLLEQMPVQLERSGSQSPSGSINNSEDFRSIGRRRAAGNDRLPGAVLLARERLLERLRGVSVSRNSRSSSSSSSIHQDDVSITGNSNLTEPENNLSEITGDWLVEPTFESWQSVMSMSSSQDTTRKRPPGLALDTLDCLPSEVFNSAGKIETTSASKESSVCLETFEDGDELMRLPCMHRFHSGCLFPWVQVCGACPNCRKAIVVTQK